MVQNKGYSVYCVCTVSSSATVTVYTPCPSHSIEEFSFDLCCITVYVKVPCDLKNCKTCTMSEYVHVLKITDIAFHVRIILGAHRSMYCSSLYLFSKNNYISC